MLFVHPKRPVIGTKGNRRTGRRYPPWPNDAGRSCSGGALDFLLHVTSRPIGALGAEPRESPTNRRIVPGSPGHNKQQVPLLAIRRRLSRRRGGTQYQRLGGQLPHRGRSRNRRDCLFKSILKPELAVEPMPMPYRLVTDRLFGPGISVKKGPSAGGQDRPGRLNRTPKDPWGGARTFEAAWGPENPPRPGTYRAGSLSGDADRCAPSRRFFSPHIQYAAAHRIYRTGRSAVWPNDRAQRLVAWNLAEAAGSSS